jgi:hypothetical protein
MNLRQRYWMAGSLLVMVALGVQRARADEAVPLQAAQWLKLGNQLQRAGRDDEALQAYLEATRSGPAASPTASQLPSEPPLNDDTAHARAKAWLNVALLYVAQASRAIDEVDALRVARTGLGRNHPLHAQRHDVARQVGAQRHRAYRVAEDALGVQIPAATQGAVTGSTASGSKSGSVSVASSPSSSSSPSPSPSPSGAGAGAGAGAGGRAATAQPAEPAFEPYTVDRWIALPRRASTKATTARSAVVEPLTESPLPAPPEVQRLQGMPPGGGR